MAKKGPEYEHPSARKYESLRREFFGEPQRTHWEPPILDEGDARHALYELSQQIRESRESLG